MKLAVVCALLSFVDMSMGHGMLTKPISRALRDATNVSGTGLQFAGMCPDGACEWYTQWTVIPGQKTNCNPAFRTMGVNCSSTSPIDFPCAEGRAVPWCAPGTAPVKSPCGVFGGGFNFSGRDMLDLDGTPQASWVIGSEVEVAFGITANHGGGYVFRICPADSDLSEECFQNGTLPYSGDSQDILDAQGNLVTTQQALRLSNGTNPPGSTWTRNPIPQERGLGPGIPAIPTLYGRGPFHYNLREKLKVPSNFKPGHYVLSWRWDAEQTSQVWSHCSDVMLVSSEAEKEAFEKKQAVEIAPVKRDPAHVCIGDSVGLDTADCAAWVDFYDAMDGPNWPAAWKTGCSSMREDPCGCGAATTWEFFLVCDSFRDMSHIVEIYVLSSAVSGQIPDSFTGMKHLKALSLVNTRVTGSLPAEMGSMTGLQMIWLDHNPMLGGTIPQSLVNLPELLVLELHYSNFTGVLPPLNFRGIYDCTLNNLKFACPLPKDAEVCGAACT
eukprot:m.331659 g.331659  ORF g.331659 m.331659 type:complete len:497 (+) comp16775_c0_seq1:97-1587(+)